MWQTRDDDARRQHVTAPLFPEAEIVLVNVMTPHIKLKVCLFGSKYVSYITLTIIQLYRSSMIQVYSLDEIMIP